MVFLDAHPVNAKPWRGIVPLRSTRAEVENLLGSKVSTFPAGFIYLNLEEGLRVEGGLRTASGMTYFQRAKNNYLRCPSGQQITAGRNCSKVTNSGMRGRRGWRRRLLAQPSRPVWGGGIESRNEGRACDLRRGRRR